jgi:predicted small lipoprotein YifL
MIPACVGLLTLSADLVGCGHPGPLYLPPKLPAPDAQDAASSPPEADGQAMRRVPQGSAPTNPR